MDLQITQTNIVQTVPLQRQTTAQTVQQQAVSRGRKTAAILADRNPSTKLFMCDLNGCEQVFKSKFSLKRHFKKHYVKKLKCKWCDKVFGL